MFKKHEIEMKLIKDTVTSRTERLEGPAAGIYAAVQSTAATPGASRGKNSRKQFTLDSDKKSEKTSLLAGSEPATQMIYWKQRVSIFIVLIILVY